MQRTLMKSKLHRATVTDANVDYMGSVTIDADLMELADIMAHERVQLVDLDNGTRLETYAIAGDRGSGQMCVNGAAARLVQRGDRVIVISYGVYDAAEAAAHEPVVVLCDEANHPTPLGPEAARSMAGVSGG